MRGNSVLVQGVITTFLRVVMSYEKVCLFGKATLMFQQLNDCFSNVHPCPLLR